MDHLEFHVAKKKISYIADDGNQVIPDKPNAIKLEMFVFDVFRFSQELAVLLVHRDLEFSPLKNASGAKDCTPEICRNDVNFFLLLSFNFIYLLINQLINLPK